MVSAPTYEQRRQERLSQANFGRKQEIVEKVREMHQQGISGHGIAAEFHLVRGTVRKYLQTQGPVCQAPRTRQLSLLDPHYDYLCQRWNEDTPQHFSFLKNYSNEAFREGYPSSRISSPAFVEDFLAWAHPPKSLTTKRVSPMLSPRELRWLLVKKDTGGELPPTFFTDGQIAIKDDKINIYRDELYKK